MNGRGFRATVRNRDPPEDVFWSAFTNFLNDIEVAAVIEEPHIRQLKLRAEAPEALIFQTDVRVGIARLRIFVECLGVGVGRGGI